MCWGHWGWRWGGGGEELGVWYRQSVNISMSLQKEAGPNIGPTWAVFCIDTVIVACALGYIIL